MLVTLVIFSQLKSSSYAILLTHLYTQRYEKLVGYFCFFVGRISCLTRLLVPSAVAERSVRRSLKPKVGQIAHYLSPLDLDYKHPGDQWIAAKRYRKLFTVFCLLTPRTDYIHLQILATILIHTTAQRKETGVKLINVWSASTFCSTGNL